MLNDSIENMIGTGAIKLTKRTDRTPWRPERKAVPEDIECFFREYEGGKFDCQLGHGWFVANPCNQTLDDYLSTNDQGEYPEYSDFYIFARVAHSLGGNSLIGVCLKPGRWNGWIWHAMDDPFCAPEDSCYLEFSSFSEWFMNLDSSGTGSKGEHVPCLFSGAWLEE